MRVLQYAVRFPVVSKYLGQLCVVMAILTLVPLGASLLFRDYDVTWRYAVICATLGLLGALLGRIHAPRRIQTNEAMTVTALIFLFVPLVMTWPVMAAGVGFGDALFETVSAVTTTGLSTLATLADKPQTFLFARAWMQWVGGLGVVVLCVAVMIQPGLVAKRLDIAEDYESDLVGSTRTRAQQILVVYTLLTLAGAGLLWLFGTGGFEALLFMFAAVSTGGFAPADGSLQGLGTASQALVILFSMAGGVSLTLYWQAGQQGWRRVWGDGQLVPYLLAALLTTLLTAFCLFIQDGFAWPSALRHGALNALSAQSTAGFASLDIASMGSGAKLALILAMAAGGCMGSTAGGIKIFRLLVIWRLLVLVLQRAGAPPDAVTEAHMGRQRLSADEVQGVLVMFGAFCALIAMSWLPFVILGHPPLDALFEVVSALGTAGISSGVTDAGLQPLLKAVLCIDMLLGRLEIIAWLVLFYPGTWLGLRRRN